MVKKNITEKVTEIAAPIVESKGFDLVDVEYVKEGSNWYLRVYLDKDDGITIDDCQIISEELSDKLDKKDPISNSYFLEVSSPGLERPLKRDKDFERYKGESVEVRLFSSVDKKGTFEGELIGLEENNIVIKAEDDIYKFDRKNVSLVKRLFKF